MFDSFEGQKGDEMRRSFLNEAGKSGELLRKARSLACFGNQYYKPPPLVDRFQCSRFLVTLLLESGKLYSHRSFGGSWTWKKATHTLTHSWSSASEKERREEMVASCFSAVWLNSAKRQKKETRSTWDALQFDGLAHVSVLFPRFF